MRSVSEEKKIDNEVCEERGDRLRKWSVGLSMLLWKIESVRRENEMERRKGRHGCDGGQRERETQRERRRKENGI